MFKLTTYSYTIILNDTECITLEAALDLLLDKCERELAENPQPPFGVWRSNIFRIKRKVSENMQLTSTNNFS